MVNVSPMERAFRRDSNPENSKSMLTVVLRFQQHELEDYDSGKKGLEKHFRDAFVLGENNIFFAEAMDITQTAASNFQKGLREYGSFLMANVNMIFISQNKRRPSGAELRRLSQTLSERKDSTSQFAFVWACLEILDDLKSGGYQITLIHERQVKDVERKDYKIGTPKSANELKSRLVAVHNHILKRNQSIRKQIVEIERSARRKNINSNLLVILGTAHSSLSETIPRKMAENMTASVELYRGDFDILASLIVKLDAKIPISKDEWVEAFESISELNAEISFGHFDISI